MRLPWSKLPKFCRRCGCPMVTREDPWPARYDPDTGAGRLRIDTYWICSQAAPEGNLMSSAMFLDHVAIHLSSRTETPPGAPCS